MDVNELTRVIEQFGRDKGIDRKQVIEAIETAMITAAKKKLGPHVDIEAHYNDEAGEIELFQFKTVVNDLDDEDLEISFDDAKVVDPEVEIGDSLGIKLDSAQFGRIAAQTAKQVINQKMRDAERELIYSEFLARKGEIISGIVRRFERGTIVVDLGKTEAFLVTREQIPGEQYRVGDRIQAFLLDVQQTARGPQIILSRATPLYLIKLFEMEVPEIYEGIVSIKSAARDPGARAKIAVTSKDSDVDPVGACVGVRGARVQNIVSELKGERIDIIPYSDDIAKFVCSALAPAEVSKVLIDEDNHYMEVVVPDSQLSLGIGRRGQNVRLAAQLTGWKIDILSESNMSQRYEDAKFSLTQIPKINETIATALFQHGYQTIFDVAEAAIDDIIGIPGFENEAEANELVRLAKEAIDSGNVVVKQQEEKFTVVAKKSADDLLREEMQQLLVREKQSTELQSDEFFKVRGLGPSLIRVLEENGISNISALVSVPEEEFVNNTPWENKEELGTVYRSAKLINNEKLIESGEMTAITDENREALSVIPGISRSVLLRLNAAGFMDKESIRSVTREEFTARMDIDIAKAGAIYDAVINGQ